MYMCSNQRASKSRAAAAAAAANDYIEPFGTHAQRQNNTAAANDRDWPCGMLV